MKTPAVWARVGGAVLLVFFLGLLAKGVADVGKLGGTVEALVSRMDRMDGDIRDLRTDMEDRFAQMDARFGQLVRQIDARFVQIDGRLDSVEDRLVRIENILMTRAAAGEEMQGRRFSRPPG